MELISEKYNEYMWENYIVSRIDQNYQNDVNPSRQEKEGERKPPDLDITSNKQRSDGNNCPERIVQDRRRCKEGEEGLKGHCIEFGVV